MAGPFILSVDPKKYKGHFAEVLFWGTCYQQHLGQDFGGLAVLKKDRSDIICKVEEDLFFSNFRRKIPDFNGSEGIGYCGTAPEPYYVQSTRFGPLAFCFSGSIINVLELIEKLKKSGHSFDRSDDVEVVEKLVCQGESIQEGIKRAMAEIKGAFNLSILSRQGIYVVCCQRGTWPLVIAETDGGVALAMDSSGFDNLGFKILRELEAGEIILLSNGEIKTLDKVTPTDVKICSFLFIYSVYPAAIVHGKLVKDVRLRLGAIMARKDIAAGFFPKVVALIPDSSRFAAIGYCKEFWRQVREGFIDRKFLPDYDEIFVKYGHIGRSFVWQDKIRRKETAFYKQLLIPGEFPPGTTLSEWDDSTVRGTQWENDLGPKTRKKKPAEVHGRISSPEILSYCPWGKTTKQDELFSVRCPTEEEKNEKLSVNSIRYPAAGELGEAIELPSQMLCMDCYSL